MKIIPKFLRRKSASLEEADDIAVQQHPRTRSTSSRRSAAAAAAKSSGDSTRKSPMQSEDIENAEGRNRSLINEEGPSTSPGSPFGLPHRQQQKSLSFASAPWPRSTPLKMAQRDASRQPPLSRTNPTVPKSIARPANATDDRGARGDGGAGRRTSTASSPFTERRRRFRSSSANERPVTSNTANTATAPGGSRRASAGSPLPPQRRTRSSMLSPASRRTSLPAAARGIFEGNIGGGGGGGGPASGAMVPGVGVKIIGGKHKNRLGTLVRRAVVRATVELDNGDKDRDDDSDENGSSPKKKKVTVALHNVRVRERRQQNAGAVCGSDNPASRVSRGVPHSVREEAVGAELDAILTVFSPDCNGEKHRDSEEGDVEVSVAEMNQQSQSNLIDERIGIDDEVGVRIVAEPTSSLLAEAKPAIRFELDGVGTDKDEKVSQGDSGALSLATAVQHPTSSVAPTATLEELERSPINDSPDHPLVNALPLSLEDSKSDEQRQESAALGDGDGEADGGGSVDDDASSYVTAAEQGIVGGASCDEAQLEAWPFHADENGKDDDGDGIALNSTPQLTPHARASIDSSVSIPAISRCGMHDAQNNQSLDLDLDEFTLSTGEGVDTQQSRHESSTSKSPLYPPAEVQQETNLSNQRHSASEKRVESSESFQKQSSKEVGRVEEKTAVSVSAETTALKSTSVRYAQSGELVLSSNEENNTSSPPSNSRKGISSKRAHNSRSNTENSINDCTNSQSHRVPSPPTKPPSPTDTILSDIFQSSSSMSPDPSVNIVGGTYEGESGVYIRRTAKRVAVLLEGGSKPVFLGPKHVRFRDGRSIPQPTVQHQQPTEHDSWEAGWPVAIVGGTHSNKTGVFVKRTPKCVAVQLDEARHENSNRKPVYLKPEHVKLLDY